MSLGYHNGMTPNISAQQYNPVRDRNTGGCPPAPPVSLQSRLSALNLVNIDVLVH